MNSDDGGHLLTSTSSNGRSTSSSPVKNPFFPVNGARNGMANNSEIIDDNDEELVSICNSTRLEFVDEPDDTSHQNICRTCRSLSRTSLVSNSGAPYETNGQLATFRSTNGSFRVNPDSVRTETWYDDTDDADVPLLQDDEDVYANGHDHNGVADQVDHCHVPQKSTSPGARRARNQLLISSVLCLAFMIAEIIGGYLSNSLAIVTDAAHMLSDLTSFLISLFAIWVGKRPPSKRMPFGYHRAEILGAVASVIIIWVLTGVLVYLAIQRIIQQEYEIDADIMLIVAACGVAMNIVMGFVLHTMCHCHTHSHGIGGGSHGRGHSHGGSGGSHNHGHSHGGTGENINVRAAFIHVLGDLLQSIGVLIAAYIIKYKPEYRLADPICTFIFSFLVLVTTFTIMKDAVRVLMEGFPPEINYNSIKSELESLEGVKAVHSLHIWSLTVEKNALVVHLAVGDLGDSDSVLKEANRLIRKKYNILQTTIQTELHKPSIMDSCKQCQGP